ncbi:SusC/RagA family TonB-linked outer membrane protein [Maribacter polysiphoniae]|uniref:TonB-linked SusC/RagA family outer membrane protein n=2 Tax=Maribacter polysiphoniae TaxID=429344 RepID=A0A316E506_9FLAO|nr:TonB-dependent receptor [Maribacter polysiphoniae]PWK24708.1 TonB-linked SusC/RagA family outer membrane protein [Maribacter polysiphoniae]
MKKKLFRSTLYLGIMLFYGFVQAQSVSGTVTDGNVPLPGASVLVKGTTNGTQTDFDGNYSLSDVSSTDQIIFSYIGMVSQTITVGEQRTINVVLEESLEALEEVVVVGYGTQKKTLVTGAGVNVKGDDLASLNTGTAMEALQGIAAGVSVTRNNGQPGAGTRVTIRGLGTIGNSNPLFIVDGVAVGDINYLNPSDIASVDVLKDAASSAIYGSRAANGVVLVTTVKGRKNSAAKITYDSYYGFQKIYKNLDPLNAQEYMYIMDEGRVNDGLAPFDWQSILTNNSWLNDNYAGLGTQLGEDVWSRLQNGWEGTNWINEMATKNATIESHAVNITGGSEDITYSAGASYFNQRGILGGDIMDAGYKRLTTRLNTEIILRKNSEHSIITIGENLTYTNTENRSAATGNIYWNDLHNALVQNPLMPAYWQPAIDNNVNEFGYTPTLDGWNTGQTNPLAVMYYRNNYNYNKGNSLVGNVFVEIEPYKDLKLRSSYGINAWFGHSRSMNPTYNLGVLYQDYVDGATQSQYIGNNQTWTTTLSYKRQLGDHKIDALIGTELYQDQLNNNISASKSNLLFPGDPKYAYLNNTQSPESISDISASGADWAAGGGAILSYMARAQYNYKEKYLFTAIMRADGSSNFAEDNRWGYFPSVSAGWVLTEEDFIGSSDILNFAKLRASWGQNGNQSIPNFIYSSQITYAFPGYFFGDTKPVSGTTAYPERVTNPDIKWETSEQLDLGFDARFFDSKLNLAFDYYKKTTKDWLVEAPALGTSGALPPYINGGDIENSGVELVLGWNDNSHDFKYGITVSGAYNKNEVTKIANSDGIIHGPSNVLAQGTSEVSRVEVGKPIGYFYGYKTAGILQNQDEVDAYVGPSGAPYFDDQRPGDVRFVDQNADGVIDENDKIMLGNPNPDVELGLQLNFEYKGFYANTTLTGKFGMQIMQSYRSFADSFKQNYTSEIFNRWHGEGTSNTLPRLTYGSNRNTNFISDIYMHDADYLRINNLTIGYDFTKVLEKITAISSLKMYMSVNNLHTFTGYNGMDPDVRFSGDDENYSWASGIDLGLYPLPRTVMFGLNMGF